MLSVDSLFLSLLEIICYPLCIIIGTYQFYGKKDIKRFVMYFFIVMIFYSVCFIIYPHACIVVGMFVMAMLIRRDTKDFLRSFYVSAFSASIFLYIGIIHSILFQVFTSFQTFIVSYPFVFPLLNLFLCFLASFILGGKTVLFKSRYNMLLLGSYNTLTMVIYFVILPVFLPSESYADLSMLLSIFVFVSSVLNICMAFIINHNATKKADEESEQRFMDIKQKAALKDYSEAIVFKHAFAGRYYALAYYIHKEDFEGLREYFYQYIQPIHSAHLTNDKLLAELEKIEDEAIRHNLFTLYDKCCSFGKKVRLYVFSDTDKIKTITDMSRTDFMATMDIFCETAYLEVRDLVDACIQISVKQTDYATKITLENSYGDMSEDINQKVYEMPFDEKKHEDAFRVLENFNKKYNNVIIRTEKQNNSFLQEIDINRRVTGWSI